MEAGEEDRLEEKTREVCVALESVAPTSTDATGNDLRHQRLAALSTALEHSERLRKIVLRLRVEERALRASALESAGRLDSLSLEKDRAEAKLFVQFTPILDAKQKRIRELQEEECLLLIRREAARKAARM